MNIKLATAAPAVWGFTKTIFPGLIISIIGGSFAFFVFNNPEKIRGKATLRAWESLKQYEKLYINNTDAINCGFVGEETQRFKNNMLHQIQMTSENLKNILEKEDNVDNLMLAIINMKIDSYNEMKNQTETFLDTLIKLDEISLRYQNDRAKFLQNWTVIYSGYMDECAYIKNRDTATINKILKELSKTYSLNFPSDKALPALPELRKNLIGNWSVALFKVSFGLKEDRTGFWNAYDSTFKCTWRLDSTLLKINLGDNAGTINLSIQRVAPDNLVLNQLGGESKNNSFLACRNK